MSSLDPATIQHIRDLYTQGSSPAQIARRLYVSETTVRKYTHDLPSHGQTTQPISQETADELYRLLDQGDSINTTAKKLQISPATVLRYRDRRQTT